MFKSAAGTVRKPALAKSAIGKPQMTKEEWAARSHEFPEVAPQEYQTNLPIYYPLADMPLNMQGSPINPTMVSIVGGQATVVPTSATNTPYSTNSSLAYKPTAPVALPPAVPAMPAKDRRSCASRRRMFWIVTAVILLVTIGGIAGGVIASSEAKKTNTAPATPAASSTAKLPLSTESSLGAANYTGPGGQQWHYVFAQDPSNSLVASVWSNTTNKWAAMNVSAAFNPPVFLWPGTPISVVVVGDDQETSTFQLQVYCIGTSGNILELLTPDVNMTTSWQQGSLGTSIIRTPGLQSSLAAWRPFCGEGCTSPTLLLYQGGDQQLRYAQSDQSWAENILETANNATGIALTSLYNNGNTSDVRWRYYTDIGGTLNEGVFATNLSSNHLNKKLDLIDYQPTSNWAATSVNLIDIMLITIRASGSITTAYWDNTTWSTQLTPTFNGPSNITAQSNFSAVAAIPDYRIYTLVGGTVYSYAYSIKNPMTWVNVGTVNMTLGA